MHLIRNSFRLTSKRDWDALKRGVRPIYTVANAGAPCAPPDEPTKLGKAVRGRDPVLGNVWQGFSPFLDYDIEIRGL